MKNNEKIDELFKKGKECMDFDESEETYDYYDEVDDTPDTSKKKRNIITRFFYRIELWIQRKKMIREKKREIKK